MGSERIRDMRDNSQFKGKGGYTNKQHQAQHRKCHSGGYTLRRKLLIKPENGELEQRRLHLNSSS